MSPPAKLGLPECFLEILDFNSDYDLDFKSLANSLGSQKSFRSVPEIANCKTGSLLQMRKANFIQTLKFLLANLGRCPVRVQ